MNKVFFEFSNNKNLSLNLSKLIGSENAEFDYRKFPDGESYFNIHTDLTNKQIIIFTSLLSPNERLLDLIFIAKTVRELGAKSVGIVSPYLGYMRQDKKFKSGEALTSKIFAELINLYFDWLITVDPHLHRYKSLSELYSIPTKTLHAKELLANWIKDNQKNSFLVGPDEESDQWVSTVANLADVKYCVAQKQRLGDREVRITFPKLSAPKETPIVLVDDIISSGYTMLESVKALYSMGYENISCLAIHGIFVNKIDKSLLELGVQNIITTNSISHQSNQIDLSHLIYSAIKEIKL